METAEAIELIRTNLIDWHQSKVWADLGCGSGVFTKALANLLTKGARIYAIDKSYQVIKSENPDVPINFIEADFLHDDLDLPGLDGILMANSLHYVSGKPAFLEELRNRLKKRGHLIIVEYDTSQANAWVPYPVSFDELKELATEAGFDQVSRIGSRKSIYNASELYGCVVMD